MANLYFGGVEGGATHSKTIICDHTGSIVACISGPHTNHWHVGIPEVAHRIAEMVSQAKQQANIPETIQLKSLGLSLSGCEQEDKNKVLENELKEKYPNVSETYVVCSDTIGSVFTASPYGGLVLIAGTGSNALLANPDGRTFTCGGWGHFLADEGSAWWISHRAIKTAVDHMDNLHHSKFDISTVWDLVKRHFNVKTTNDMLDHCYAKFNKAFYASLCTSLADAANSGDPLCRQMFIDAGRYLAKSTLALTPKVDDALLVDGNLNIVCVGSVWKSWNLLMPGYTDEIQKANIGFGLNLLHLTKAMAIGAVYIGVDALEFKLPRDYRKNYEIFHKITKSNPTKSENGHCNGNSIHQNGTEIPKQNGTHAKGVTNGSLNGIAGDHKSTKCPSIITV